MPQIDQINTFASQIFWLFFSFAIIYFMISKVFGPKVSGILVSRSEVISSNVNLAEKLKNEAADIQKQYSILIADVKTQANELKNTATKNSVLSATAEQTKVDAELNAQISNAEREITESKTQSLKELEGEFVTELAGKITSELANLNLDKQKIEAAIKAAL